MQNPGTSLTAGKTDINIGGGLSHSVQQAGRRRDRDAPRTGVADGRDRRTGGGRPRHGRRRNQPVDALPDRRRRVDQPGRARVHRRGRPFPVPGAPAGRIAAAHAPVAALPGHHAGRSADRQPVDQLDAVDRARAARGDLRHSGRRRGDGGPASRAPPARVARGHPGTRADGGRPRPRGPRRSGVAAAGAPDLGRGALPRRADGDHSRGDDLGHAGGRVRTRGAGRRAAAQRARGAADADGRRGGVARALRRLQEPARRLPGQPELLHGPGAEGRRFSDRCRGRARGPGGGAARRPGRARRAHRLRARLRAPARRVLHPRSQLQLRLPQPAVRPQHAAAARLPPRRAGEGARGRSDPQPGRHRGGSRRSPRWTRTTRWRRCSKTSARTRRSPSAAHRYSSA